MTYTVMERTNDVIVDRINSDWSDVCSFSSLQEVSEKISMVICIVITPLPLY